MDNIRLIYKNGKKLRTGYTTGSCAAAVAKAAVHMLFKQCEINCIDIDTPKGWTLKLDIYSPSIKNNSSSCYVIKDAGDDPDITDGVRVYAKAEMLSYEGIEISTGKGIGIVTRDGLSVKKGNPAINPIPMEMIQKEVAQVLPKGQGVNVELSIPEGVELAKKTFNPKLGIVGGISVLGTSGIVEPMSEDAIKDTIALELSCYKNTGESSVVLVPGNYGEDFCKKQLNINVDNVIKISNYLGYALEKCVELDFQKLIIVGHIGKLVKVAGGIFYTHSRTSDTRMEILTANLGILGADTVMLRKIMDCRTTEEAIQIIDDSEYKDIYDLICEKCAIKCENYIYNSIEIGVFLFSMKRLLSKSSKANSILGDIK